MRKNLVLRNIFSLSGTQSIDGNQNRSDQSCGHYTILGRQLGRVCVFFPLSNWTEIDIWQYIFRERIKIVPLYFAAPRPTVERNGLIIMVDDDRMPLNSVHEPVTRSIRFRTLGCYPLTGAIRSEATTLEEIIQETLKNRNI